MQVVVSALCTRGPSLRVAIGQDTQLEKYTLQLVWQQQPGRHPGWMKLHSTQQERGAINIEWDADSAILMARVVTKGSRRPSPIVGDFVNYLMDRFRSRIMAITIASR